MYEWLNMHQFSDVFKIIPKSSLLAVENSRPLKVRSAGLPGV